MTRSPRRSLKVAAAVTLLLGVLTGGTSPAGLNLVADEPTSTPQIAIHEAPEALELHQGGLVKVKASAPASAGGTIYLNTPGAYGAGWIRVAESVLGEDLTATLRIPAQEYLGSYRYWASIPASGTTLEAQSARFDVTVVAPPPQSSPTCGGQTPLKADGTPWRCTFSDEFEGVELDRRYWVPQRTENSGFTTGTLLTYACAFDDDRTVRVHDGVLALSLVDLGETRDCGARKASRYAYGQVMHYQTYAQTYGRYEIRAKIPDVQVPGVQQSFWLWPEKNTYGPWPASGEIDIAEMYSSEPGVVKPFIHYYPGASQSGTNQNVTHTRCPIDVGEFNTYGLIWEPRRLTILVNGEVCMVNEYSALTAPGGTEPFDHPFFLALNQAMGTIGNQYTAGRLPEKVTTLVDYVRIWQ